jgi:hypothetical protein
VISAAHHVRCRQISANAALFCEKRMQCGAAKPFSRNRFSSLLKSNEADIHCDGMPQKIVCFRKTFGDPVRI